MAPLDISHTSSYRRSIVTVGLSCIISNIKLDIGRNYFITNTVLDVAVRYRSPSEYYRNVWRGQTRIVWLSDGEKV